MMAPQEQTILVYSGLELVGDAFLKLPLLRALRGTWPHARITWLAGKGKTVFASRLRFLVAEYLDEVIEDASIGTHPRELLARPLPGREFDLIIDTQRRVLTTLIVRRIRHRTFVSSAMDYRLSDRRPYPVVPKRPSMQDQLMELLTVAAGITPTFAPPPTLPPEHIAYAERALPSGARYVGLVPGAGDRRKCWPLERFAEVARSVSKRGARPVFLLGPDEGEWFHALRAEVPDALFPLQDESVPREVTGSPEYTMALGKYLTVAVTNDCGASHILAAENTGLICLFGPTPSEKFAPACTDRTVIRAQDFPADGDPIAMSNIPLGAVIDAVDRHLVTA